MKRAADQMAPDIGNDEKENIAPIPPLLMHISSSILNNYMRELKKGRASKYDVLTSTGENALHLAVRLGECKHMNYLLRMAKELKRMPNSSGITPEDLMYERY